MENCVHASQSGKMRSEPDLCVQCVLYLDPLFKWQFAHSPFGVTFSLFSVLPIVIVGVAAAAAAGFVPDSKSIDFIVDDAYF